MKKLIILFVFFAGQLQAQNSNLSIVSGATSGGTWSPLLSAGTTGTTYTFTPNVDNATVSKTEIDDLLRVKTSNVIINTACITCTQAGQFDFNTVLSTYNQTGPAYTKTLTINAASQVNVPNSITMRYTGNVVGNWGGLKLVINTPQNIIVTADILMNNPNGGGYGTILTDGGSLTLNSTGGAVKVAKTINCSGTTNPANESLYSGAGGIITINGAAGVSISGTMISTGRSNYAGNIFVSDGYATVTNAGQNDGISGVITGGAFKKTGVGILKLSGGNNAVISSEIADGTLQLSGGTALPDYNTLTFSGSNAVLDLNGVSESIGSIASLNGFGKVTSSVAGNITLTLGLSNFNTVYTGLIEDGLGVLSLAKYGESFSLGNATHSQANTYSGVTTIYAGVLAIYNSNSLGNTLGGTVVRGTGQLALYNTITVGPEDLTLNTNGVSLSNISGNNILSGSISLGQNTTINSTSGTLTLTQTVTGSNVSLITTGAGSMTISGTLTLGTGSITTSMGFFSLYSNGNYSGVTSVASGILQIRNSGSLGSGNVTVGQGGCLQMHGGISILNSLTLNGSGPLGTGALQSVIGINAVGGNITLTGDTRINSDLTSQLTLNSSIFAGAMALTVGGAGDLILNGSLNGTGSTAYTWGTSPLQLNWDTSLIKEGTGSLTLMMSNTYTGATVLSGGYLVLGGSELIPNVSLFLFNGGGLRTGGFSETVGYFSLLADGSSIDLGSNPHQLRFGRRLYIDYKTLTITGWQGTAGISGTGGQVYIVTSPFLAKSELEQIKFSFNSTWNNAAQLNTGELVVNTSQAAGNANVQFIAGLTKNGSWSPIISSNSTNTTYIFTPTANNASVNVAELATLLGTRYSNVIVNTVCLSCTQSGILDIKTPILASNQTGPAYNKSLTFNGQDEVNINSQIALRFPGNYVGNAGSLNLYVNAQGTINLSANINSNVITGQGYGTILTEGGSVYLNSIAGNVMVYGEINTSGAINPSNPSLYSGTGGTISIVGAAGVSVYGALTSTGRTNFYGNVTLNTGNPNITTGYGINDGVASIITGRTFSKLGVGTLKLSAVNQFSEVYMYAGTLQMGVATAIPASSPLYFSGGNFHDGGFNATLYSFDVYNNATITLGNAAHNLNFTTLGMLSTNTMLTFAVSDGSVADVGLTTYGAHIASSTAFVNVFGKKQSAVVGGINRFGNLLSTTLGATDVPIRIFLGYDMSAGHLGKIQFYNSSLSKYYTATQKPVSGTNGEILPLSPK
ncbi:MAG: hypothetical protein RL422_187 [Bacteroidota bacterium]|jgi:autotransporter-associated beta strand protein